MLVEKVQGPRTILSVVTGNAGGLPGEGEGAAIAGSDERRDRARRSSTRCSRRPGVSGEREVGDAAVDEAGRPGGAGWIREGGVNFSIG